MHPLLTFSDTPAATFLACVIKFCHRGVSILFVWGKFALWLHFVWIYDCNLELWGMIKVCRKLSTSDIFLPTTLCRSLCSPSTSDFSISDQGTEKIGIFRGAKYDRYMYLCYFFGANFCAFHGNVRLCCLEYQQCASGLCQKRVGLSTVLIDQIVWWWALEDKWC